MTRANRNTLPFTNMASPRAEHSVSVEGRRPWYRLHLSTWLLLAPVALVLIVVPGQGPDPFLLGRTESETSHGWPLTFLTRTSFASGFQIDAPPNPAWLDRDAWSISGDMVQFSLAQMAADVAVSMAIIAAVAALVEWRRRRRFNAWQVSLRELLLLPLLLALVLGWWRSQRQQRLLETEVLRGINESVDSSYDEYRGPDWLRRLVGERNLEPCHRSVCVSLRTYSADLLNAVSALRQLHHVEAVTLTCSTGVVTFNENAATPSAEALAKLKHIRSLRSFDIDCPDCLGSA